MCEVRKMENSSRFNFGVSYASKNGNNVREHRHECYEIVYYLSCSGYTEIDGRRYDFSPGTLALLPPQTPHTEVCEHGGRLMYIGFDTNIAGLPGAGIYRFGDERISALMREILDEVRRQKPNYELMTRAKLSELCVILTRCAAHSPGRTRDISYVKNYIDENYNLKINFALIAAQCGCSYSCLRHKFKQLYGVAPQNYLVKVRLENARAMLSAGERNCTEVCYCCGFSNSSQFSKMFKREYGITPKNIKKGAE